MVSAPVAFCNVVARGVPLTLITDCVEKFEPVTASWKPTSPEVTVLGEIDVMVGTIRRTLRLTIGEVCPPGFVTAIGTCRATATSVSATEMVS